MLMNSVLGTNPIATDGYDFYLDLPSAPEKPFPSLSVFITREAPEDIFFRDKNFQLNLEKHFLQ